MAQLHFLVVTFPGQGHINPARGLAKRLARTIGARVTLSTAISAHRLMFPSLAAPDEEFDDGVLSYIPYSDGYDNGFKWFVDNPEDYREKCGRVGPDTISAILDRLAARGQPVTRVIYTIMLWWVGDVAHERGIPSALCWIQPATMLAVYYHYFHGYQALITAHVQEPDFVVTMPALPPMTIRELPSFFTNTTDRTYAVILDSIRRTLESMELDRSGKGAKPKVLVNTFEALEAGALASVPELDIIPIGPTIASLETDGKDTKPSSTNGMVGDLYKQDEKAYMEWLDMKPARSLVYVSFGSISGLNKRQQEEIKSGLEASGRPYLWVVRKNNREEGIDLDDKLGEQGMVVEWCNQVKALSHPAVGCFVTHCGWNSTLESVTCGVPMVAVPQWTDQDTNARLIVEWNAGVRAAVDREGVLEGGDLKRCLEMVMGDGERGVMIRRSSKMWKAKARDAIGEGGSSDRNFKTFLDEIAKSA